MKTHWEELELLILLTTAPAFAATGESFLEIPVGAREVAMGGAFTGLADDADSLYWNPGGLGTLDRREVTASAAQLFAGMNYEFAGYTQPTRWGTIGVSGSYLSQGTLQGRDDNGNPTGSFTGSDMAVGLGFGRNLSGATSLGGQVKLIRGTIADVSASGVAVDLGVIQRAPLAGLQFGLAVRDLGPGVKFLDETTGLPTTFAAGASYALGPSVTLVAEADDVPGLSQTSFAFGGEYSLFSALFLRGGYSGKMSGPVSSTTGAGLGALAGAAGGLGFRIGRFTLDYAFTPFGELGNVQRISVGGRF